MKMNKKQHPKNDKKQINIKNVRVGKLDSIEQVAKLQARLIKKAVKGGGEVVNDSYKIVMCCSMLAKTLEVSDLETRIEALEAKSINK
jgi:hypothetical protein